MSGVKTGHPKCLCYVSCGSGLDSAPAGSHPLEHNSSILLLGLWACGREARECGQPVGRACTMLADRTEISARSMGCPHGFSSGRSAGKRTRPHIHRPTTALLQTHWLRTPGGRLRRWIMLIYVDWVPPDFTTSRSWPFSKSRDRRAECPLRDSPVHHRYSKDKGSPHRPRMP